MEWNQYARGGVNEVDVFYGIVCGIQFDMSTFYCDNRKVDTVITFQ